MLSTSDSDKDLSHHHNEGLLSHVDSLSSSSSDILDRYKQRTEDFREGPFPSLGRDSPKSAAAAAASASAGGQLVGAPNLRPSIIRSSPSKLALRRTGRMSPQKYAALSLPRVDPPSSPESSLASQKRKLAVVPSHVSKKSRTSNAKSKKTGSRFDSSLSLLTRKFLDLVQSSPEGTVDLTQGALDLGVQKRRIYDITNVLQGVGLIEKTKNKITWTGAGVAAEADKKRIEELGGKLNQVMESERRVDEQLLLYGKRLKELAEDSSNVELAFVTHDDLAHLECFESQTLIAIKAPSGTKLEVPHPDESNMEKNYQIFLSSPSDPIDIYLIHTPQVASDVPDPTALPLGPASSGAQATTDWNYAAQPPPGPPVPTASGGVGIPAEFVEDFYLNGDYDDPGMVALWSDGDGVGDPFAFQS